MQNTNPVRSLCLRVRAQVVAASISDHVEDVSMTSDFPAQSVDSIHIAQIDRSWGEQRPQQGKTEGGGGGDC